MEEKNAEWIASVAGSPAPSRDPDLWGKVVRTPGVCGGRPRLAGTRIGTEDVYRMAACGFSIDKILDEYPSLFRKDVEAALAYERRPHRRLRRVFERAMSGLVGWLDDR